jgi:hypothetical protein
MNWIGKDWKRNGSMIPLSLFSLLSFASTCQINHKCHIHLPSPVTRSRYAFRLVNDSNISCYPTYRFSKHRTLLTPAAPIILLTSFFVLPSLIPNQVILSTSWKISRGLSLPISFVSPLILYPFILTAFPPNPIIWKGGERNGRAYHHRPHHTPPRPKPHNGWLKDQA